MRVCCASHASQPLRWHSFPNRRPRSRRPSPNPTSGRDPPCPREPVAARRRASSLRRWRRVAACPWTPATSPCPARASSNGRPRSRRSKSRRRTPVFARCSKMRRSALQAVRRRSRASCWKRGSRTTPTPSFRRSHGSPCSICCSARATRRRSTRSRSSTSFNSSGRLRLGWRRRTRTPGLARPAATSR